MSGVFYPWLVSISGKMSSLPENLFCSSVRSARWQPYLVCRVLVECCVLTCISLCSAAPTRVDVVLSRHQVVRKSQVRVMVRVQVSAQRRVASVALVHFALRLVGTFFVRLGAHAHTHTYTFMYILSFFNS